MTKKDITDSIACDGLGLTKEQSAQAINAFLQKLGETLKSEGKLTLVGFGCFRVKVRKARVAVRPGTKTRVKVPAKKVVTFRASPELNARTR